MDYTSVKLIFKTKTITQKLDYVSFLTFHPIYFFQMAVLSPLT